MKFFRHITCLLCVLCLCLNSLDAQQTIGIFTYKVSGMKPWDPESVKTGIAGSEEAVIYMSEQLAKLGYKVLVYGDPPKDSIHTKPDANPRYLDLALQDGTKLDIAISWRMPDAAQRLKLRARKVYLWPHDTYPYRLSARQIEGFTDVLWISRWQRENWIADNPEFAQYSKIFGNGINTGQFREITARQNPQSCIYGSNYARGLEILLDIWPAIKREFPKATLDIYYGWQHWGLLTPETEAKMRKQIVELASSGVRDHGLVSHDELNRAYESASLWTYPCIAPEVFCITALRAQYAGAIPVIIEGSALPETVRHGYKCSTADQYPETLLKAMRAAEGTTLEERRRMRGFIADEYTWERIAQRWKELFDGN